MTPCAACPEEAESEILTSSGVIPVCSACVEMVWSIETTTFHMEHLYEKEL